MPYRTLTRDTQLPAALGRARGVFFQADEQTERAHLDLLTEEVARLLGPRVPLRFAGWDEALYGRADYRPLLSPLDFRDAARFGAGNLDAEQRLRRYAVLGGTPQYQVWVGEISNTVQVPTPNLTKMLSRLEILGYLEARAPLGPKGPEAKRTSYRLTDPFFRFWFRFVFPNRSLLERGRVKAVLKTVERDLDTYMGRAFEDAAASGWGTTPATSCRIRPARHIRPRLLSKAGAPCGRGGRHPDRRPAALRVAAAPSSQAAKMSAAVITSASPALSTRSRAQIA